MKNNTDTTFIENLKVNTENIKEIVSHVGKFLNNFDLLFEETCRQIIVHLSA